MHKLKFNTEISLSHIILVITFLMASVAWKAGIETDLSNEAHARELADAEHTESIRRISQILDNLESRVRTNDEHRIKDEAHVDWVD